MSIPPNDQPWASTGVKWLDGLPGQYNASVARALCAMSTWAYSEDFGSMIGAMGFAESTAAVVRMRNEALFMDNRAFLVQSKDGTVIILCFQGTPPFNIGTWFGNFSVRADSFYEVGNVHGGFGRAMLAMFPWIDALLIRAGLIKLVGDKTDYVESVTEAAAAVTVATAPGLVRYPARTPVQRYTLLNEWGADPQNIVRALTSNDALKHAENLLKADANARLAKKLLSTDSESLRAALRECVRHIGDAESFTDALHAMDAAEVTGVLQRERHSALEEAVKTTLYEALDRTTRLPLERLYITGHSLGGALAVLAAAHLCRKHPEHMQKKLGGVYTFGQPMVGDAAFADRCEKDFGDRLFRHIFHNDVVPRWPPRSTGRFKHAGKKEYWSTPNGWAERSSVVDQTLTALWSVPVSLGAWLVEQIPFLAEMLHEAPFINSLANRGPFRHSIADHSPMNYLRTSYATAVGTEFVGPE